MNILMHITPGHHGKTTVEIEREDRDTADAEEMIEHAIDCLITVRNINARQTDLDEALLQKWAFSDKGSQSCAA